MTRHVWNFCRNACWQARRARGDGREKAVIVSAASALVALSSACFSPAPYTEHLCRECESQCPDGLVCHEHRCVRVCDATCVGDFECDGGACLPSVGAQCPTRAVSLALCVGAPVDTALASTADSSSTEPWVVLDSRLPEGVAFDSEKGMLVGTPTRAEPGSITVRRGEPGSEEVSLDVIATESCASVETRELRWCAGQNHSERLVASPERDYEWVLTAPMPGLSQRGDELAGRIEEPNTYELQVELREAGRTVDAATITILVEDCTAPTRDLEPGGPALLGITQPVALPIGCEGMDYSAVFQAAGGEPAYHWSLATAPLGLALDEATGVLSGVPRESGDFELAVGVDDSAGNHDEISAALHIQSASEGCDGTVAGEETECGVGDAPPCERPPLEIVSTDLGIACAGEAFAGQLEATGGGGDYSWSLLRAAPGGLTLDENGLLHGVPSANAVGEHNIVVFVMSTLIDTPSSANVKLEVALCDGLVFISDEPNSDRLLLASPGTGSSSDLSAGLLGAGENVHTFAFAPSGAQLAFDVRNADAEGRLYWVDLATLEVREAAFGGELPAGASLIDYRWSLDGRYLAATFGVGNDVFLGVLSASDGTGSSIEISGRYVANLFWAAERICYVAPGFAEPFLGVFCHEITAQGVQNQAPLSGIFDPIDFRQDLILSGDEGYLAILRNEIHADFLLPEERATSIRHASRVFSPGLHRAAGLSTTEASVGEVVTAQGTPSAPAFLARLEPCDNVDAWSLDERWLACRDGDALAIHQLSADGSLARSARVEGSSGYAGEEFRRLWAPAGQWYAYASGDELHVVPTGAAPPRSRLIGDGGASSSYAGLSTDSAGQRIFYHHGAALEVIDARADFRVRNVNGDVLLSDPAPCLESYLEEGPRLWCGAQTPPAFVFPAPVAPRVAFVDRQNLLYVADVSDIESTPSPRLVHPSSVKCTMDSGETQCNSFVQWVPRASQ